MSIHIGAKSGEIADTVLLPGDPLRAEHVAKKFLENTVCYNKVRGMYGFTGNYKGKRVSVQGTGMGIPSISIYVNELISGYNVTNLVRIGTCGSIQSTVGLKDIVLAMTASTDSQVNKLQFQGMDYAPSASFPLLKKTYDLAAERHIEAKVGGVLLKIHPEKARIDLFNFKEVENSDFGDTGDKNVIGAYGDFGLIKNHTTQAFLIWQRTEPTSELSRFTAGFYARGKINNFFHETEFAYQGGEISNINVSAYLAALNIGYTFAGQKIAPTVAVGIDYLSGDDDLSDDTFKTFNTLYATNHKYYGFMDYFLNIPVHTQQLGLQDFHIKLSAKPSKKWHVALAFHNFQASKNFTLTDGSTSTKFGNEIDLTVKYNYLKNVTFMGGCLHIYARRDF